MCLCLCLYHTKHLWMHRKCQESYQKKKKNASARILGKINGGSSFISLLCFIFSNLTIYHVHLCIIMNVIPMSQFKWFTIICLSNPLVLDIWLLPVLTLINNAELNVLGNVSLLTNNIFLKVSLLILMKLLLAVFDHCMPFDWFYNQGLISKSQLFPSSETESTDLWFSLSVKWKFINWGVAS